MNIYYDIESPAWKEAGQAASDFGLVNHGILNPRKVYWNLPTPALYEEAIFRGEARMSHLGPLLVLTGKHTGRSAADKYIVREQKTEGNVWWGEYNRPYNPENFTGLLNRMQSYLQGRDVFVQDLYAGADPENSLPIRIITEKAWHSLFVRNMFMKPRNQDALKKHVPEFTIIDIPSFRANPLVDQTRSETFILANFSARLALIGGSAYGGEIKKTIFTVLNFLLPLEGVMSMHCSANIGKDGDTALFFGLSGTGKTTLVGRSQAAADRRRRARLERQRHLQFRGRLLRQGDPPLAEAGAADSRLHAALRHHSRERGHGSAHAQAGFERRPDRREHAGGLPAQLHR